MSKRNAPDVTVWYDGGCPLCVREIAMIKRLDRDDRIRIVNVDRDDAVCPIDRNLLLSRFHAREGADGALVDGAAAFAAMWRAVPLFRPLGRAARIPVVLWTLERLYSVFLIVRPAMQWVARSLTGDRGAATR